QLASRLEEWRSACPTNFSGVAMHLFGKSVCELERGNRGGNSTAAKQCRHNRTANEGAAGKLRAVAAVLLTLAAGMPAGVAQQNGAGSSAPDKAASELPAAPAPAVTQQLSHASERDFSKPFGSWLRNPINVYLP